MCLMTHLRNFYYHPDTAQDKRTKKADCSIHSLLFIGK